MTDQFTSPSLDTLGQRIDNDHDNDDKPLEIKPLPGFMRYMPQMIKDFHNQGATIITDKSHNLRIQGFYNNGDLLLIDEDGKFFAEDKNKKRTKIASFEDLVALNYEWWLQAQTRGSYVQPERPWLDKFREQNRVTKKVIYVPNDQA